MERVLDFIKWSLITLLFLVLVWAALAATKWLPRPTDVQISALKVLATPPTTAVGQHNAFAAVWLWQYDIPAADLDTVTNADLQRARDVGGPLATSTAEGRYRKQDLIAGSSQSLCSSADYHCLAKVRAHPEDVRQTLVSHALLLDHAHALAGYDYYHDEFPPNPNNPLPQLGGSGMLLLGDAALKFVDGDKAEGLAQACAAALTWRRLTLHSDSQVVQVVASSYYIGASKLIADMRAELPADAPLPASCETAYAPVPDAAINTCDLMKIEFAKNVVMLRQVGDPLETHSNVSHASHWSQTLGHLLTNGESAVAYSAPSYASFCTHDAATEHAARDLDVASLWQACGVEESLFDPIGCRLVILGNPRRRPLNPQGQDLQRMNVLMRATMAQGPDQGSGSSGHGALPAGVVEDATTHSLGILRTYFLRGEPKAFTIPLPGSRLH